MEIKVIKNHISRKELMEIAKGQFGNLVKAVVDAEQGIMAIGGELHADEEVLLMEQEGSKREHIWVSTFTSRKPVRIGLILIR